LGAVPPADLLFSSHRRRIFALGVVFCLCAGLLAVSQVAKAADQPMSHADILKIVRDKGVLCEGWRSSDESCQSLLFLDAAAGGLAETNRLQMADGPDVTVGLHAAAALAGGAVCTRIDFGPSHAVVLVDGEPSDSELAGQYLDALKNSLAAYDGKRACETFRRDANTGVIRSTTTIDGQPAPELDSTYRLLAADAKIHLRPLFAEDGSAQSV
jgi:hypothetical protein